jgi:hypothetical protein
MLITLKYFGSTGNGCSAHSVKGGLGISVGSAHTYVARSVEAILSLSHQSLFWPDADERKNIKIDRAPFTALSKEYVVKRNGKVKKDGEGKPVMDNVIRKKGRPKMSFLEKTSLPLILIL